MTLRVSILPDSPPPAAWLDAATKEAVVFILGREIRVKLDDLKFHRFKRSGEWKVK